MNPGIINPTETDSTPDQEETEEKLFCQMCQMNRPPRAHHCKTCNVCVALKDHHCKFINNCVGARNYRSFIIFLFASFSNFIQLLIYSSYIILYRRDFSEIICWITLFSSLFFTFNIFKQLYHQIPFLYKNMTWVESTKMESKYKNIITHQAASKYDTGSLYQNLKQRLGSNPIYWLLPIPNNYKIKTFPINPNYIPLSELQDEKLYTKYERARNRFL